ncbi:hypothetical protein HAX54_002070, partial [Datura stramonium]|nr:hypothetical protein [Datura stramonium]
MPEGSTPRKVPALMDEGPSLTFDSSSIEADTSATHSVVSVSIVPLVISPLVLIKPYIAKYIGATFAPVHEEIKVLYGRINGIEEGVNERLRANTSLLFAIRTTLELEDDEEGIAKRAHKRERKTMKEELRCSSEEIHIVGEVGALMSRAPESAEHIGDQTRR